MVLIGSEMDKASRTYETVGFLVQVPGGVKPPDSHVRKVGADILTRNTKTVRCAMVLEGSGFWASATRSVFTAITAMSSAQAKVFAAVPDSYGWLEEEMSFPNGELAKIVAPLRARPVPVREAAFREI